MRLNHLALRNFRNYANCELEFPNRVNLVHGDNAQGKTSLLEAIYFLSTAKSHRAYPNDQLIRHNESWFYIKGVVESNDSASSYTDVMTLEVSNQLNGKRSFKLNGDVQPKLSQWLGQFNVIFFSPESLTLVKGSPADRRRFVDILISSINATYLGHLQSYHFALKQRNQLLKQIRSKRANVDLLEAWDTLLIEDGIPIIQIRARILQQLNEYAQAKHGDLVGHHEKLEVAYQPSLSLEEIDTTEHAEATNRFRAALERSRSENLMRGTTSVGPHRDDFKLLLETHQNTTIAHQDAKVFGSQGQQRTIALALKLGGLEVIRQSTGKTPIVLLDDVISELDEKRVAFLLDLLQRLNAQTFITSTRQEVSALQLEDCRLWTVKNGEVF